MLNPARFPSLSVRPLTRHFLLLILLLASGAAATAGAQGPASPTSTDPLPPPGFVVQPDRPEAGILLYFNTTNPEADARTVNWTWRLGDGAFAYGPRITHTYETPGRYLVELWVLYDNGLTGQAAAYVILPEPLPPSNTLLPDWLFFVLPFVVGIILLAFSYFVLQKGQPVIYNYVFFLLFTASGAKSLTEAFAFISRGTAAFDPLFQLNQVASYVYAPLFLWFVLVFPRPVFRFLIQGKRGALALLLAVPFLLNQLLGWMGPEQTTNVFNIYVSLLAVGALALLVYHSWETDSEEERLRIRLLAAVFFLLVLSALVLAGLNILQAARAEAHDLEGAQAYQRLVLVWGLIISPLLEIVGAGILVYAILRYQLMGVERLVMKVTKNGIVAVLVPSIFVTVGNSIELVFETFVVGGLSGSFLIAGFISAIVMIPIQKWSTFLVHRLFPGAMTTDEVYESKRRVEIFEAQLRYSLLDGALNDKEVRVLQRLLDSIGLRNDEFHQVADRFPRADLGALREPPIQPAAA